MGGSVSFMGAGKKPASTRDDAPGVVIEEQVGVQEVRRDILELLEENNRALTTSATETLIPGIGSPIQTITRLFEEVSGIGTVIVLTPRDAVQSDHNSPCPHTPLDVINSIPYTPHGDEASIFKYYCPLCMQYFKDIMKMKCCGNYLCISCCRDYIQTKRIDLPGFTSSTVIEEQFIATNAIACPHCGVSGFHPLSVSFEEIVRDYSSRLNPVSSHSTHPNFSPLRVGESFEDLKRKMIPYKTQTSILSGVGDNDGTPRDSEEQVVPYKEEHPLGDGNSSGGIAMAYHGTFSPSVENNSPRVRLEPETPEFYPRYAVLDEAKETAMPQAQQLFQDELSGSFTHPVAEDIREEGDLPQRARLDMDALPIAGMTAMHLIGSLEDSCEQVPSPNEVRVGSPSPRYVSSSSPRSQQEGHVQMQARQEGHREENARNSRGPSRSNSIPRSENLDVESGGGGSGGGGGGGGSHNGGHNNSGGVNGGGAVRSNSASDRGRSACEEADNVMGVFATGVVECVLRAAVAQQASSSVAAAAAAAVQ